MTVLALSKIAVDIARRKPLPGGLRLVGVDGPSGSGKTTLARRLAELVAAPVVKIDDFVAWSDIAGWWPRFDAEVLTPLLSGFDATYRVRDWTGDEFGTSLDGEKTAPWAPTVILEGVTCTRRATVGRLTYAIWVEAPEDLRLQRGLERDGESHREVWRRWMTEERQFFLDDGTRARADLRVDGAPGVTHGPSTSVVLLDY